VVEDCFADPPILTGVTVSDADARQLAPCEPRVPVGIAHNKTNNDHPLPIQPGTSRCAALSARRGHPGQT
jgi:hypothetical protein